MSTLYTIWSFIRHYKYLITIAFFAVFICFAGEDSIWARRQRHEEIDQLRAEQETYRKRYVADSITLEQLESNPKAVERMARERYHMKRANEDIFLLVGEPSEMESEQ